MKLKLDFQSRLLAAFAAAILVVALLTAATWKLASDATQAAGRVENTLEVLNYLAHIRSQTVQIELSTQSYRISGNPDRLNERNATIAERESMMQKLRIQISDNPAQQAKWLELRGVLDERLRISRHVEHLRETQGQAAATAYVATAPLQATRDHTNRVLGDMEALERELLKYRMNDQDTSGQHMLWSEAVLSGLLLMLFVLTYLVMRRQLRSLEASRYALADSENGLATTLHSIGDGVIATDTLGRITRMNTVAEQLTGWTLAQAKGRLIDDVFHIFNEETRLPAEVPVAKVLATGVVHELANHTVLLRRDGSECPIADSAAPIRSATGEVRGVVIVFRDETEARQLRQTIAEQNKWLQQRVQDRTYQLNESQTHLANILIRPYEVLSRISNVAVPEVAHHALGVLLQHRHVFVGRLA